MTPRQRDDDNNLSVGNRNHLKLGIEPESWLQSHELGFELIQCPARGERLICRGYTKFDLNVDEG